MKNISVIALVVAALCAFGAWAAASYFAPSAAPFVALFVASVGAFGASGAWAAAYYADRANRQNAAIERTRLTLDFIRDFNSARRVDKAIAIIQKLPRMDEGDIVELCVRRPGEGDSDKAGKYRADLLFFLNQFEMLAIGLKRGIYDEELIKQYFGHDIHGFYDNSKSAIKAFRKINDDQGAFCEFEKLAARVNTEHLQ